MSEERQVPTYGFPAMTGNNEVGLEERQPSIAPAGNNPTPSQQHVDEREAEAKDSNYRNGKRSRGEVGDFGPPAADLRALQVQLQGQSAAVGSQSKEEFLAKLRNCHKNAGSPNLFPRQYGESPFKRPRLVAPKTYAFGFGKENFGRK